ncbi:MAG: hypothetical protein KDA66_06345, partial [Planctomycetaceae bacterium]|nr:hypothetical protein [Planctomycetaceae bacterium]
MSEASRCGFSFLNILRQQLKPRGVAARRRQRREIPASIEVLEQVILLSTTPTEGPDFLVYDDGPNNVSALGGDDTVFLNGGDDVANGNGGRDIIDGGPGNDFVRGGQDDDIRVSGGDGNDRVYGDFGNDLEVNGNAGDDFVFGGDGNDIVRGGSGDDWVYGDADPDLPPSNPVATGNDWIAGDLGNDQLFGQGGADTFFFQQDVAGTIDTIHDWNPAQGDRIDLSRFDARPGDPYALGVITDFGTLVLNQLGADLEITLPTGQMIILKNTASGSLQPSHFLGKASIDHRGSDALQSDPLGEQLNGREGNDTINGSTGSDNINGNTGRDTLDGGPGNDTVRGGKDDDIRVFGGEGDDIVYGDLGNDGDISDPGLFAVNGNQGRDRVYGGPGNDVVRGGADDDFEVFGDDGDDWVYGDDGDDLNVNGNRGNDHVFGGNGNDVVRGGKDDDYVFGDDGDDWIYGDLGVNVLTGGQGKDRFVFQYSAGATNTITDFETGIDKIDVTRIADLVTFEGLTLVQQGASTVIQLGPDSKLTIQGKTPGELRSTDFIGPWSAHKDVYLWVPGALHSNITDSFAAQGGANATTPTGDPVIKVDEYRISGFRPEVNPGNLTPHRPFQLIDLRSISITNVTWRQSGEDTIIDLPLGKILRLVGVSASQLTQEHFLTTGEDEQAVIDAYLSDWEDQSQIDARVVPPADRFTHEGSRVIYESTPMITALVNGLIGEPQTVVKLIQFDSAGPELQVFDDFNPASPFHKIDVTGLGVTQLGDLGLEQLGPHARVALPGGKTIILLNVSVAEISEANLVGMAPPIQRLIFSPKWDGIFGIVEGFDPSDRSHILDLTDLLTSNDFNELTLEQVGDDVRISTSSTAATVTVIGISSSSIAPQFVLGNEPVALVVTPQLNASQAQDDEQLTLTAMDLVSNDSTLVLSPHPAPSSFPRAEVTVGVAIRVPLNSGGQVTFTDGASSLSRIQEKVFTRFRDLAIDEIIDSVSSNSVNTLLDYMEADLEAIIASDPDFKRSVTFLKKQDLDQVRRAQFFAKLGDAGADAHEYFTRIKQNELAKGRTEDEATTLALAGAIVEVGVNQSFTLLATKLATKGTGRFADAVIRFAPGPFKLAGLVLKIPVVKSFVGGILGGATGDLITEFASGPIEKFFGDRLDNGRISVPADNGVLPDPPLSYVDSPPEVQQRLPNVADNELFATPDGQVWIKRNTPDGPTAQRIEQAVDMPVYGEGIDPGKLARPQLSDNDTENGQPVQWVNGRWYQWTGESWIQLPEFLVSSQNVNQDEIYFADSEGATATETETPAELNVSDVLSSAVASWYQELTTPDQTGLPQGVVQTASQAAGVFLAEFALNGNFSDAIERAGEASVRVQVNKVLSKVKQQIQNSFGTQTTESLFQSYFSFSGLSFDIATTIGEQLIRGEFDDSFASQIVTQSVVGAGVGFAFESVIAKGAIESSIAGALGFDKFFVAGFDPLTVAASIVFSTVLNRAFADEIAEVSDFVGDVGETVWDIVRDPVNTLKDLFDDPKFGTFVGTTGDDTLHQDSLARQRTDLLEGNDTIFGADGWGIIIAGPGDDIITHGNPIPGADAAGNGIGELYGEEGSDLIRAGGGPDELHGGGGADVLFGGSGDDYLWGGDAQRTYSRNTGEDFGDYLDGGLGNDV